MSRIVLMGKEHRWLTAAGGLAVAVALALILVPVTFERTVGHTVELSVRGEDLTASTPAPGWSVWRAPVLRSTNGREP